MKKQFAVASGHKHTTETAIKILENGGNAYDAIVGALWTATVVEPSLSSLGGGGFCLVKPKDGSAELFDFFVQTPGKRTKDIQPDFYPVEVDFGGAIQEFHIGRASVATPGTVAGLFTIWKKYGRLPMKEIVRPAVDLARNGFEVEGFQAFTFELLKPIFEATTESRRIFSRDKENLVGAGDILKNPDLAKTMEFLAESGEEEFYRGEIAKKIVEAVTAGGYLQKSDLQDYQINIGKPLQVRYGDGIFLTNPLPSAGGTLIALTLKLLDEIDWNDIVYKSADYIAILTEAMRQTQIARREKLDDNLYAKNFTESFLAEEYLQELRAEIRGLNRFGSTTHISVRDDEGNMASLTASNGEGSGIIVPGTGIILNNMLGEEDLNPDGFHRWPINKRLSSMMAPSIFENEKVALVLGSAGSNRIRSAILQTIIRVVNYKLDLETAVNDSRLHFENGKLDLEEGFSKEEVKKIKTSNLVDTVNLWKEKSLFFGGANCLFYNKEKQNLTAVGDIRRDGKGVVRNF